MAYNSMSLHPNHMIKGLSCRQEARLQIISLLLNMVLTYTCAIFKTTKTYKTLHQFYGSLYNEPVDHILVWSNTNYFWFILLPQISREIHFFLEDGDHVYFLEWFSLNHTKFELTFSKVHCLSTPSEETLSWPLVVTLSKEYTYHWSSSSWEGKSLLITWIIGSTTQLTTPFLLRTLKTQTSFKNNYNSERKSITSSLLKSMNLTPLHQGGLPLQLLVDLHPLLSQQSIGTHKPSVSVN